MKAVDHLSNVMLQLGTVKYLLLRLLFRKRMIKSKDLILALGAVEGVRVQCNLDLLAFHLNSLAHMLLSALHFHLLQRPHPDGHLYATRY